MDTIGHIFAYLWNGGLNPDTADLKELRQRRTLSTTVFVLLPIGMVLSIANILFFTDTTNNTPLYILMVVDLLALWLQARYGLTQVATHLAIFCLWLAPTTLIFEVGLNTSNWSWLFPVVLIAHLLGNHRVALFWTLISIATLLIFATLTSTGLMALALRPEKHAAAVAVSGTLILLMVFLAGYAFRNSQQLAERMLESHIRKLDDEIVIRRQAEEAAIEAQKSRATFLATVSHELRTPLNGVIGAGQLLNETELTSEQKELLDVVTSSGEMLLALINDVLDLTKLEAGKVELEQKPIAIRSIIGVTLAPMVMLGRNKKVDVHFEVSENFPAFILGDATRLRQILFNLVGNALKFTHRGSVKVSAQVSEDRFLLIVEDSGIGISKEAQEKLFQPFTQAESSITRRYGGTGLGLTIVAQLVEMMDGKIELESETGKGARFTLSFPLIPAESPFHPVREDTEGDLNRLRVLVTDDNAVNRMVAARMLGQMKHEVVEACDGEEALLVLSKHPIDIVLMDLHMPNMDGLTATRKIREMPGSNRDVPIIGLTADVMSAEKDALLEGGMDAYLPKPVHKETLKNRLEEVYSSRRGTENL